MLIPAELGTHKVSPGGGGVPRKVLVAQGDFTFDLIEADIARQTLDGADYKA